MKKILPIIAFAVILTIISLGNFSDGLFFGPSESSAQQSQVNIFDELDELARLNRESPSQKRSKAIAEKIIDSLSVLDIPFPTKDSTADQLALAHLNGSSTIDENNIAFAVNNLANDAAAPAYAQTNSEQVKVIRKFLNRLMPNLVSANGNMTDLEAFAVFAATVSQKFDNEAFMVTPAEFTASLGGTNNDPFPGTSASTAGTVSYSEVTPRMTEMEAVLESYLASPNLASPNQIVSMIGIN